MDGRLLGSWQETALWEIAPAFSRSVYKSPFRFSVFGNDVILAQPVPLRVTRKINGLCGCRRKGFRLAGLLVIKRVAVEKLAHLEFAEIGSRQEALQRIFSDHLDIFYRPIFGCVQKSRLFQQPQGLSPPIRLVPD